MKNLHTIISYRGMREQSFKFAFGFHGGMKNCYTKGCDIFCPLSWALRGVDLSFALQRERTFNGEIG